MKISEHIIPISCLNEKHHWQKEKMVNKSSGSSQLSYQILMHLTFHLQDFQKQVVLQDLGLDPDSANETVKHLLMRL